MTGRAPCQIISRLELYVRLLYPRIEMQMVNAKLAESNAELNSVYPSLLSAPAAPTLPRQVRHLL